MAASLELGGEHARLYAGAGIVAGSDPEREFAETDLKFRAMREALGGGRIVGIPAHESGAPADTDACVV